MNGSSGIAWTQIFWRKCFKIKIPNLNQIRLFSKKIDYVNFEYLWMSNFMQKIRKNEWTVHQVLHEHRFFWRNAKCFNIKIPHLNHARLFSKKLIMSILSIYECLTLCKKSEKTNERFFRYCMKADFLKKNKMLQNQNPKFGPNNTFFKKIDYVNFEYLWMSNFMQKIRKND